MARFLVGRDAVVAGDGAFSCIVGAQSAVDLVGVVLIFNKEIAKKPCSAFDILGLVMGVNAERLGGGGHELHDTDGAFGREGRRAQGGFHFGHAENKFSGQAMAFSSVADLLQGGGRGGWLERLVDDGRRLGGRRGQRRGVQFFDGSDGGAGEFECSGIGVNDKGVAAGFDFQGCNAEAGVEDNFLRRRGGGQPGSEGERKAQRSQAHNSIDAPTGKNVQSVMMAIRP